MCKTGQKNQITTKKKKVYTNFILDYLLDGKKISYIWGSTM